MEEIGWAAESDRESLELTMPRESLVETLLNRGAREGIWESMNERGPPLRVAWKGTLASRIATARTRPPGGRVCRW